MPTYRNKIVVFIKKTIIYLSGRAALDHAPKIAMSQGIQQVIRYLEKLYPRYYRPITARFWIQLYQYFEKLTLEPPLQFNDDSCLVHFSCWGEEYAEKAIHFFLPSLNAAYNQMQKEYPKKMVLLIHCDSLVMKKISESPVMLNLSKIIRVHYYLIPCSLLKSVKSSCNYPEIFLLKRMNRVNSINKYYLLGILQTHALKIALENKLFISFMMPDFLLSNNFLCEAFKRIEHKIIACTTAYRSHYTEVKNKLNLYYQTHEKKYLSVSPEILTQLQIEHIHPAAKRRVVSENTENFSPSPQLIFQSKHGYVIRSFHYHPILIDCSKINKPIQFDYLPIDNSILNQIIKTELDCINQVYICDSSSIMAMMELSSPSVEKYYQKSLKLSFNELIHEVRAMMYNAPQLYNLELNRYFSSVRHEIFGEKINMKESFIDDMDFFEKLNFDAQSPFHGDYSSL